MYAEIKYQKIKKGHVSLRPEQMRKLCKQFDISEGTARKYLSDIYNENITAQTRNKVLVAAINEYKGKVSEVTTYKDVLVINKNDVPENHM